MSWNGSEQLQKAMEEVLEDDVLRDEGREGALQGESKEEPQTPVVSASPKRPPSLSLDSCPTGRKQQAGFSTMFFLCWLCCYFCSLSLH